MNWTNIALMVQLFFGIIIGLYFWNLLRNQRTQKSQLTGIQRKKWSNCRR